MKRNSRKKTEINIRIGGRLKRFRMKNGISADELAEAFGIVKDSLMRIENGSTGLSSEYAYILAIRYNCDMNYLFGGVISEDECLRLKKDLRKQDSQYMSRLLHYIADLVAEK